MKKKQRCYIYTRVSTAIQVDGYSLDAQRDKLIKYAEYQEMEIVHEYSDQGKSGKSVEGRPEFMQMLEDIKAEKEQISYVLVYKLSRFGRNAADVLTSLQLMQDYGVNLVCVEDGIDSSKDAGKLMISVLSAVAEIERENIQIQTMEGRRQKAREGKWNGGFAPYGYKLVNGYLIIEEDEMEIIRIIFDKYLNTSMGAIAITEYLNSNGYKKKLRQNNTLDYFTENFVSKVLDNAVYCGRITYGKRTTEKVTGTRNEYRQVKSDDYIDVKGVHEGIISEEEWALVQAKRKNMSSYQPKTHSLEHEHLLSGLLKCPKCGGPMYGNVNRKKKEDGSSYKDYFFYRCQRRKVIDGKKCDYTKQWSEEVIDDAVAELISSLVTKPKFEDHLRKKVGDKIDTSELESENAYLKKQIQSKQNAKERLGMEIDRLDETDRLYELKYEDMQGRLYKLYEDIDEMEEKVQVLQRRIDNIMRQKISGDQVYEFLLAFDRLYKELSDKDKKKFLNTFIERIELYEMKQPSGQILKKIRFRFPIFFNGEEIDEISWDNDNTVETVCCLHRVNS
jgi:site-specific DNA recombinase